MNIPELPHLIFFSQQIFYSVLNLRPRTYLCEVKTGKVDYCTLFLSTVIVFLVLNKPEETQFIFIIFLQFNACTHLPIFTYFHRVYQGESVSIKFLRQLKLNRPVYYIGTKRTTKLLHEHYRPPVHFCSSILSLFLSYSTLFCHRLRNDFISGKPDNLAVSERKNKAYVQV